MNKPKVTGIVVHTGKPAELPYKYHGDYHIERASDGALELRDCVTGRVEIVFAAGEWTRVERKWEMAKDETVTFTHLNELAEAISSQRG